MLVLNQNTLEFSFPEVHPDAKMKVTFIRTLRIPDDGKAYPLPPGLGDFPMRHVDDYRNNVPAKWVDRQGVMIPMWQSEALWIKFEPNQPMGRGSAYPFAVKVAAGKRDALTGAAWWPKLRGPRGGYGQDYCIVPGQPWLDGFVVEKGKIRQFVAQPLGQGLTVEAQLDGKEEFGGIQLQVYPMKGAEYDRRFPYQAPRITRSDNRRSKNVLLSSDATMGFDSDSLHDSYSASRGLSIMDCCVAAAPAAAEMGLGAGGLMDQSVYQDPFRMEDWDQDHTSRTYVHLLNSALWQAVTGGPVPTQPLSANLYARYQYPWYQFYQDGATVDASPIQQGIKSIQQLAAEKGISAISFPTFPVTPIYGQIKTGNW
jgi:hypothetical protein